ncbi:MAG: hypothetical protein NWQ54_22010 [Paraglaciecola sp.]|nr:hypothetical protein [Paraglaciecola sp.]
MESNVFAGIKELKQVAQFDKAWELGFSVLLQDNKNLYLKTSLFWVCYSALKPKLVPISNRENKSPNAHEVEQVNKWMSHIFDLNLDFPNENIDFRFFNLFKGIGQHFRGFVDFVLYYNVFLFKADDFKPYVSEKGESPSWATKIARLAAKAWLSHGAEWQLDFELVVKLLNYAAEHARDKNKIWLYYDTARCLAKAGKLAEARQYALNVLRQKMSESWAWGALAGTYSNDNKHAAISCFCKGIIEAKDPQFEIPMLYELAKLLAEASMPDLASLLVLRLETIYRANNWRLRAEHEELLQQPWFDASLNDEVKLQYFLKAEAEAALQYAGDKFETHYGFVKSHHRSGKGCHVALEDDRVLSVRKSVLSSKKIPVVGQWLQLKCSYIGDEVDVIAASIVDSRPTEKLKWIEGSLKLNPKGFGFLNDVFIAPHIVAGFQDTQTVKALVYWSNNPKRGVSEWQPLLLKPISNGQ